MSLATGLVALGTTQGTALEVNARYNALATVAASTGVRLPVARPEATEVVVRNGGANTVNIYPPVGRKINGGTIDAAVTLASGSVSRLVVDRDGDYWVI